MADNPNFPIGTAATNWIDAQGNLHIRVYSTDGYNVIERCADGGGWTDGGFKAPGSQVSVTSWQGKDGIHLRVYCTFQDKTTEYCADPGGSWYVGGYSTT